MTQEQMKLFYKLLDTKNIWSKNEVRKLLLEVISGIYVSVEEYYK